MKTYDIAVTTIVDGDESANFYRLFDTKKEALQAYELLKSFYTCAHIEITVNEYDEDEDSKMMTNRTIIETFRLTNEDGEYCC